MVKKKRVFVLKKVKTLMTHPRGKKPTRFRFRGNLRMGFRRNDLVEIVRFKPVPIKQKKVKGGKK